MKKIFQNPAKISLFLKISVIVLLFATLLMPFADAIKVVIDESRGLFTPYGSGFSFIFGTAITTSGTSYKSSGVSIVSLIGYLFLLLSFISITISLATRKNEKISLCALLVNFLLTIVGSIMLYASHSDLAYHLATSLTGSYSDAIYQTIYSSSKLMFGILGTASFAIVSGAFSCLALINDNVILNLFKK